MPNVSTPTLKRHPDGRFLTRWGGKRHYFGRDRVEAAVLYADSLREWAEWRATAKAAKAEARRPQFYVVDLVKKFLASKLGEGGRDLERYYAKHLRRFGTLFGGVLAKDVRVSNLDALKHDMVAAGYAPKTVNHDLVAIKAMTNWGADRELVPYVRLKGCKTLPLGPPPDKSMTLPKVLEMIGKANDKVRPWLCVNFLTFARPSEVVRLVHGQGVWVEHGIFRLDKGKMDHRSRMARHMVVTKLALRWLRLCKPAWSRLDSYSQAVRDSCGPGGPGALRHSAATRLHSLGVDRDSVDLLLGHAPTRVSLIYSRIDWRPLRRSAARIGRGFDVALVSS